MESLDLIRQRIQTSCARCGRDPRDVTLVGASKTVEAARLEEFFRAGLTNFGENYIQEGIAKVAYFRERDLNAAWHFIGALQSNKAREAVAHFDLIHSLDRISLARALDKAAHRIGKVQRVLIQVNLGEESSKGGVMPDALVDLSQQLAPMDGLKIEGLMSLPPAHQDAEVTRGYHRRLRQLLGNVSGETLSMGMSGDFEMAIEEGAKIIRVGTALFGRRE